MDSNLPPGVSVSDIPGNRPEDEAWDDIFNQILESGLEPNEVRELLRKDLNAKVPIPDGDYARLLWALEEADNPGNASYRIKMALGVLADELRFVALDIDTAKFGLEKSVEWLKESEVFRQAMLSKVNAAIIKIDSLIERLSDAVVDYGRCEDYYGVHSSTCGRCEIEGWKTLAHDVKAALKLAGQGE
jgi:hypothetical protein